MFVKGHPPYKIWGRKGIVRLSNPAYRDGIQAASRNEALDDFEEWLDEKEVEDLALEDVDEGNEED